jgi:Zn-dependent peptidase ImmA (M78 family)/transcriptional regulator with XRE-family HTH domain
VDKPGTIPTLSGPEQLREAVQLAPLTSSERIRLARELRGWTQLALVGAMTETGHSISAAALSQLELGKSTPSGRTLLAIAQATAFPIHYFVRRDADGESDGFFRSLRSAPAKDRRRAVARAYLLHDFIQAIEHYVELPDLDIPRFHTTSKDRPEVEAAASLVRRTWKIDSGPIPNMVRALERHGVVTCRLSLESQKLDAFSVWFPDRPVVALVANKGSTARSRFDAAHELGHGVMHTTADIGTREAETEAHQFASAFLMPAEDIKQYLPSSVNWQELMDVKARWGVSLAALLIRARDLGVLTPHRFVSAMKYMSAKGWRREEPGDRILGKPELPRLTQVALRQIADDGLGVEELALEAGLPPDDVLELISTQTQTRLRVEP